MQNAGRSQLFGYGGAVLITGVALLLAWWLKRSVQPLPYLFFLLAVILSMWFGGRGPGLLCALLLAFATVVSDQFVLPAGSSFTVTTLTNFMLLAFFVMVALLLSTMHSDVREARQRAEATGQRLNRLVQNLDSVVWEGEAKGHTFFFTFISERAKAILGYSPDQGYADLIWANHIHPEDRGRTVSSWQEAIREVRDYELEYRVIAADGRTVWLRDVVKVFRIPETGTVQLRGMMTDITERKHAERLSIRIGRTLDHSANEIYIFDATTLHYTQVNKGARRNLGYTMEELVRMTPLDLAPELHPVEFGQLVESLRNGEESQAALETVHRRKDGSTYAVEIRLQLSRSEEPMVFIAVVHDITARKRAEVERSRQLQEQTARVEAQKAEVKFRAVLESAPDAIVVADRDDRITLVNSQAERMFGYHREELIGQPAELVIRDRPGGQSGQKGAADPRSSPIGTQFSYVGRRKDGAEIPIEVSFSIVETDQGTQVTSVIRDVTERRRVEDMRSLLASIVESSTDAVISITLEGRILTWNPAAEKLYGYSAHQVIGQPIAILVPLDETDSVMALIRRVKEGKSLSSHETQHARHDGSRIDIALTLSPIRNAAGKITSISMIARDITESKRAENELRLARELSLAFTETETVQEALEITLRKVCETTGWILAQAWIPAADGSTLKCSPAWHTHATGLESFRKVSEDTRFPPGIGLPGRAWASKKPVWVRDVTQDSNFPRAKYAKEVGLAAGMAVPVLAQDQVVAVLEFFVFQSKDKDERLLNLVSAVVAQLGSLVQRKLAEEGLKTSQLQLAEAQSIAHLANWEWDILHNRITWSEELYRIYGLTSQEFTGTYEAYLERIHPDDREPSKQVIDTAYRTHQPFDFHERILRPDGTVRILHSQGRVGVGEDGQPVRMYGTCQDVTELKQAEEAMRTSAERTRLIVDKAYDAFISMDADGRIVDWNTQAEVTFGWSRDEAVGRELAETIVPPTYRAAHQNGLTRFLVTGEGPMLNRRIELSALHRDGHQFPVELTISPLRFGATYIFSAFVHDITERKLAQEALRESEGRYRTLLDHSPVPVGVHREGKMVFVNPAGVELLGAKSEKEIIGFPILNLIHPDYRQDAVERLRRVAQGELHLPIFPEKFIRLDGREIDVEVNSILINYGEKPAILTAVMDVTERKKAEEQLRSLNVELERRVLDRTTQLEAANKELEAFAYSVSHDLRAPLRTIDGFSHALLEDYTNKLDDQGKDFLARVRAGCQRMGQLIEDLLNLSRLTRGEMQHEKIDLSGLAQGIAAELQQRQPDRRVSFAIQPGLTAQGDSRLLRVALENLLGNAWKFTNKQPEARIELGASHQNGQIAYYVRDNGAGFDMAYADKLFGAFQRLHRRDEFEGTGIGLATVQRIIHRHGGKVWAEGAIGKGATFYFTI